MAIALLVAIPVAIAVIMYFVFRSRLPTWAKVVLIAVLTLPFLGAVSGIIGVIGAMSRG